MRQSEKGSALVWVLIAVALFAALSYTVAGMMRVGSPEMITGQKAQLYADSILDYARALRQAVQGLRIDGCSDTDVSFTNTTVSGYAHTPAVIDGCKVFAKDGGGMVYIPPDVKWLDSAESSRDLYGELFFPEKACVDEIGAGGEDCQSSGLDTGDLVLVLPWLNEATCKQINKSLGYGEVIDVNTTDCWDYGTNTKFTGAYSATMRWGNAGNDGRMSQCVQCTGAPNSGYHFYQVLLAR